MIDDSELPKAISTIVSMCRENGIDVQHAINKAAM